MHMFHDSERVSIRNPLSPPADVEQFPQQNSPQQNKCVSHSSKCGEQVIISAAKAPDDDALSEDDVCRRRIRDPPLYIFDTPILKKPISSELLFYFISMTPIIIYNDILVEPL